MDPCIQPLAAVRAAASPPSSAPERGQVGELRGACRGVKLEDGAGGALQRTTAFPDRPGGSKLPQQLKKKDGTGFAGVRDATPIAGGLERDAERSERLQIQRSKTLQCCARRPPALRAPPSRCGLERGIRG